MALEAVVFPQELFGCSMKEFFTVGEGAWSYGLGHGLEEEEEDKGVALEWEMEGGGAGVYAGNWDPSCSSVLHNLEEGDVNSFSPPETPEKDGGSVAGAGEAAAAGVRRRKRRRTKSVKNKEEVENQRMTHIAVERNRRRQMNEYLAMLRSIMPPSYVQRGDQASIIGGAINFVRELEQLLQSLEAKKRIYQRSDSPPFADFFTFPQYSSSSSGSTSSAATTTNTTTTINSNAHEAVAENRSAIADIEVSMVESHANLKLLSRRRPKQLLKMVVGLQNLRLTTLHLNVTTIDEMVLYSFSLKVEDGCQLNSVDDIATAVYQIVEKIQEEAGFLTN